MNKKTEKQIKAIGLKIHQAMQEQGISITELSRLTKLNRTTIYTIINGTHTYSIDSLMKVNQVLTLSIRIVAFKNALTTG
jgi:transcriptional regulator with XRE-family HTH domain